MLNLVIGRRIVPLLVRWFAQNARALPWRRTRDPYAIWVSEVMLQQTQVKTVVPYWERWMRALPNISALGHASQQRLHKLWEGLGYYTRVRNMQCAAKLILEKHEGHFPDTIENVMELPGIGRYTAGAICSIAYDQPTPILDGNVTRVLSRLICLEGNPRDKTVGARLWTLAEELVKSAAACRVNTWPEPKLESGAASQASWYGDERIRYCSALNQALMELGALVCTPRTPECQVCPLTEECQAYQKGSVAEFPQLPPRTKATARWFMAFAVRNGEHYLIRQRAAGQVNAHLWEFPNVEVTEPGWAPDKAAVLALGTRAKCFRSVCVVRHSITRYRIAMEVFTLAVRNPKKATQHTGGQWVSANSLRRLPLASAHRKALSHLGI